MKEISKYAAGIIVGVLGVGLFFIAMICATLYLVAIVNNIR